MVVTRIRFSVSVPVLSVQTTLVEPSVSTAESRFTTAPRRARARTPAARARVTVGSRPSGTLATSRPIANVIVAVSDSPEARPSGTNATPTPTAITAISRATRLTWCSSGLSSRRVRWLSAAIRPSSVCMPVAVTTPSPCPPVHVVPLKSSSRAWSNGPEESTNSAERNTGTDSPVSADRSTSTPPDSRRASAQIREPSSTTRTSPGTRVLASTS
ncbi:hypothetical protein GCM10009665_10640 [Kitasatospora nipponensis]|uniref:Secreted protein n=1 Tax=Kitasatospora nipponensis TaxID=258049 RepID=A0ABN1VT88_9ACTN